jgi:hypothetical protein
MVVGLVVLGLLLALAVFVLVRFLASRTPGPPSRFRTPAADEDLVEMVVLQQNSKIGLRNVHRIRPGTSRSVGGGRSSFLIYFVPMPRAIARISFDGRRHVFRVRRREFFPGLETEISDCLYRHIPVVSARGFAFGIYFRPYRSPLAEINRLMRSIRHSEESDSSEDSGS